MAWELNGDRPIYLQLIDKIERGVAAGRYKAGERLPGVRELAGEASVNPNTMQKALGELERMGLVYTQRTAGRFITEDGSVIENLKSELAKRRIEEFFSGMEQIGFTRQETIKLLESEKEEGEAQ